MLADLDAVLGRGHGVRGQIAGYAAAAACEGISIALLVPVLRALLGGRPADAAVPLGAAAVAAAAAGVLLWVVENRAYRVGVATTACGSMRRLGEAAVTLPLGWFDAANRGRLTRLVTEATSILMSVPGLIVRNLVAVTVTPLVVVVVTAFVDPRVALAMVALVPVGWFAYRRVQRVAHAEYGAVAGTEAELVARVTEFARAQPVLRAAGVTERRWARLDGAMRDNRAAVLRQLGRTGRPMTGYMIVVELGFLLVLAVSVLVATHGAASADVLALLVLAARFREPVSLLAGYGEGIALARVSLAGIRGIVDTPPLPEPATPAPPRGDDLALDAVTFAYAGGDPVLRGLDLAAPGRGMTALVGPSGSGKTTVTRMLARFFDPVTGAVRRGGTDLRELGTAAVMDRTSLVFQHVHLFDGTIADNVRLADPGADDTRVAEAAARARLDEVVDRLPDGWHTRVGEGGSLLSGGERQRVSLARAFLADAPVLLLDEISSALDGENEAAVHRAVEELVRDRTVVVVAHRLGTIAGAERIAYVDAGRVVECGTHEELLAGGGLYAQLWAERSAAAGWRWSRPGGRR
ncbi:ABC transporter ATP-binding protein [Pseudonocardia sp. TMWB2A]